MPFGFDDLLNYMTQLAEEAGIQVGPQPAEAAPPPAPQPTPEQTASSSTGVPTSQAGLDQIWNQIRSGQQPAPAPAPTANVPQQPNNDPIGNALSGAMSGIGNFIGQNPILTGQQDILSGFAPAQQNPLITGQGLGGSAGKFISPQQTTQGNPNDPDPLHKSTTITPSPLQQGLIQGRGALDVLGNVGSTNPIAGGVTGSNELLWVRLPDNRLVQMTRGDAVGSGLIRGSEQGGTSQQNAIQANPQTPPQQGGQPSAGGSNPNEMVNITVKGQQVQLSRSELDQIAAQAGYTRGGQGGSTTTVNVPSVTGTPATAAPKPTTTPTTAAKTATPTIGATTPKVGTSATTPTQTTPSMGQPTGQDMSIDFLTAALQGDSIVDPQGNVVADFGQLPPELRQAIALGVMSYFSGGEEAAQQGQSLVPSEMATGQFNPITPIPNATGAAQTGAIPNATGKAQINQIPNAQTPSSLNVLTPQSSTTKKSTTTKSTTPKSTTTKKSTAATQQQVPDISQMSPEELEQIFQILQMMQGAQ